MARRGDSLRYAVGTGTSRVGIVNMYIYGGSILSALALVMGLATTGTVDGAVDVMMEFYLSKAIPWPLDELLLAETLVDLFLSHAATVIVGLGVASTKYHANT